MKNSSLTLHNLFLRASKSMDFSVLSYRQIQALAKSNGIPANGKREAIIEALLSSKSEEVASEQPTLTIDSEPIENQKDTSILTGEELSVDAVDIVKPLLAPHESISSAPCDAVSIDKVENTMDTVTEVGDVQVRPTVAAVALPLKQGRDLDCFLQAPPAALKGVLATEEVRGVSVVNDHDSGDEAEYILTVLPTKEEISEARNDFYNEEEDDKENRAAEPSNQQKGSSSDKVEKEAPRVDVLKGIPKPAGRHLYFRSPETSLILRGLPVPQGDHIVFGSPDCIPVTEVKEIADMPFVTPWRFEFGEYTKTVEDMEREHSSKNSTPASVMSASSVSVEEESYSHSLGNTITLGNDTNVKKFTAAEKEAFWLSKGPKSIR